MNSHKNARTTYEGRKLLIARIAQIGLIPAAEAAGISVRTARKWLERFEGEGEAGLWDRRSRPRKTRASWDASLLARVAGLRRQRTPMRPVALLVGRSLATISRWLANLGLYCNSTASLLHRLGHLPTGADCRSQRSNPRSERRVSIVESGISPTSK